MKSSWMGALCAALALSAAPYAQAQEVDGGQSVEDGGAGDGRPPEGTGYCFSPRDACGEGGACAEGEQCQQGTCFGIAGNCQVGPDCAKGDYCIRFGALCPDGMCEPGEMCGSSGQCLSIRPGGPADSPDADEDVDGSPADAGLGPDAGKAGTVSGDDEAKSGSEETKSGCSVAFASTGGNGQAGLLALLGVAAMVSRRRKR